MRIRSHLLLLAFSVVLPVAAFSIFLVTLLVEREQRTFAEGSVERLRSTMNAVDAQVQGQIAALKAIAASDALDADDLQAFQAETARVLHTQDQWLNILLAHPDGKIVVNVSAPWRATEQAYLLEPDLAPRVISTKMPVAGVVVMGPGTKRKGINLAVPVIRGGQIKYVLIGFVTPALFLAPIERQRIRPGWASGLVDAKGTFIARVPPPPGERASPDFMAAVQRAPEGWYRGTTAEGGDAYAAHITSALTNWSIGLAIPANEVLAGAHRTAWLLTGGILVSLALASLFALYFGRRVARPIVALAEAAHGIAHGTAIAPSPLDHLTEANTVASALSAAAAAVRDREALLEREKKALQEGDRAKDEFIAMMSHELRNPLAALSSASHLLDSVDPNAEAAKYAREVIKRQTKHTGRLIEDLLDVSRVVMGKAYLQLEPFNLADAASSVCETWRSAGRFDQHRVTVKVETAWIRADRSRIEQIVSNLLDNALKFTPEGRCIDVIVRRVAADAQLDVVDEGPGLSPEMMEKAFDLFVQGPQGLARRAGGLGIGLALVKRLAELQGGTVSVSSNAGAGAVFSVRFPETAEPQSQARQLHETAANPRCVLLVEDNEDVRQMFAASLRLRGHTVHEAPDGMSGLRAAEQNRPEIAIIDIGLPDIDGYEVARRLRANDGTRRLYLVATTGYGQEQDRREAADAGFDEHLTKPVDLEVLNRVISRRGEASSSM